MKKTVHKVWSFIFIFLFLSISFQFYIIPVVGDENKENDFLVKKTEKIGFLLASILRFNSRSAAGLVAKPSCVKIGYNESTTFEIGLLDLKNQLFKNNSLQDIVFSESLTFTVSQYPSSNEDNKWRITFDPPEVTFKDGVDRNSTVTLSLTSPPIGGKPIQSGLLIITVNRTRAYGDLWFASQPKPNIRDFLTSPKGAFIKLYGRFIWFMFALNPLTKMWGRYSGTMEHREKNVTVLVKVKPSHQVLIDVPKLVTLQPNQIGTISVNVTNLGNYKDTIGFRLLNKSDGIKLTDPLNITLRSGDTKPTLLGVGVDPDLWDSGTIHKVKLAAYSLDNPKKILSSREIIIETRGVYVSDINIVGLIASFLFLCLTAIFLNLKHRKKIKRIAQKPEKPWNILEEKSSIHKLKEQNKKQYKQTMQLMKQEYQSVMLWYKHYTKAILRKKTNGNTILVKITKKASSLFNWLKNKDRLRTVINISTFAEKQQKTQKEEKKIIKKLKSFKTNDTIEKKKAFVFPQKNKGKNIRFPKLKKKSPISNNKQRLVNKIKKDQNRQQKKFGMHRNRKRKISKLVNKFGINFLIVCTFLFIFSQGIAADSIFEIKLYNRVDVTWDIAEAQKPILPRDEVKALNLTVFYTVDTGNYIADGMYDVWKVDESTKKEKYPIVKIELEIIDFSPWCSAALKSNLVYVNFSKNQTTTAELFITVDEDAPCFGSGFILINATAKGVSGALLKQDKKTFNLSFTPSYLPYIHVTLDKDVSTVEVNPMEQVELPFQIENLGNARTKVFLEVINLPNDWNAVISNEITLDEKVGYTTNATLTIQPPKNFGYHDEKEIIRVAITPARAEDISDRGDTYYVTFLVKSKGIGTPGFDSGIIIPAFVFVCIGFYLRKTKKK